MSVGWEGVVSPACRGVLGGSVGLGGVCMAFLGMPVPFWREGGIVVREGGLPRYRGGGGRGSGGSGGSGCVSVLISQIYIACIGGRPQNK